MPSASAPRRRSRRIAETATTADAHRRAQADLAATTARTRSRMRKQEIRHAAEWPDAASDLDHPAILFDNAVVPLETVADRLLRLAADACAEEEIGKLRAARAIVRVHDIRLDFVSAFHDYCHGDRSQAECILNTVRRHLHEEASAYLRQPGQFASITDGTAADLIRYLNSLPSRLLPAIPRKHARRIARDRAALAAYEKRHSSSEAPAA